MDQKSCAAMGVFLSVWAPRIRMLKPVRGVGTTMRIFIADDSPAVVERQTELLGDIEGIQVVGHARDVNAATRGIQELNPDVVILDMKMPGGSGLDVLEAVKRTRPDTVVIVLTNFPGPQMFKRCQDRGASFFLDKSTEFDRIPRIFGDLMKRAASSP